MSRPNTVTTVDTELSAWKFAVRALRHRNYRLFFGGQGVSLIGTWMTKIATAWLVYRLTHSAVLRRPDILADEKAGEFVDEVTRLVLRYLRTPLPLRNGEVDRQQVRQIPSLPADGPRRSSDDVPRVEHLR